MCVGLFDGGVRLKCAILECHFEQQIYANILRSSSPFFRRQILSSIPERKALESDLIECFLLLLSLSTLSLFFYCCTLPDRISIDFCRCCLFQNGIFTMCLNVNCACQQNRPDRMMCFFLNELCDALFTPHSFTLPLSLQPFVNMVFFLMLCFATLNGICSCFVCVCVSSAASSDSFAVALRGFKLNWAQYISHA